MDQIPAAELGPNLLAAIARDKFTKPLRETSTKDAVSPAPTECTMDAVCPAPR